VKRARAEALVLVNWKGVFYERYLLDDHVTALEGANGAGKTTVMIAAYVVLLPDLTRLRFTNLGESAATGGDKGIYGRLGDANSPAFAALDFRLGHGDRLLAGVHLQRRTEPTVELNPFVVTGLDDEVRLQDILLDQGEVDAVPDLNRLRELVTLRGGHLRTFAKTGDYFAELFERGVTPLRLTGDEERTKLNEMLRTSMVGGISRALTGGLREFLLRAETGLADTLKRMRGNLTACRRTRLEVENAQRMEEEIRGVYQAGQDMFVAAIHASRKRADELHQRVQQAQHELNQATDNERQLAQALATKTTEHDEVQTSLNQTRQALEEAVRRRDALRTAHRIAQRIGRREAERGELAARADRRNRTHQKHHQERQRARQHRASAQELVKTASLGLADFQQGLDQLHRRAAAFEQVSRRLTEAQHGLPHKEIGPETVSIARREGERNLEQLDGNIVRLDRTIATATAQHHEHQLVLSALTELVSSPVEPEEALATARRTLQELRELDALATELPELPARIEQARQLTRRQHKVRGAAAELTAETPLSSAEELNRAFSAADQALEAARDELSSTRETLTEAAAARRRAQDQAAQLEQVLPRWQDVHGQADQLQALCQRQTPLSSQTDVQELQDQLLAEREQLKGQYQLVQTQYDELLSRAGQLEHSGGEFSAALLRARDALGGELLAGHFDDVDIERAGRLEALLGPLAQAIVVENAEQAARQLTRERERPATLWLVDEETTIDTSDDHAHWIDDSVLVLSTSGCRLTKQVEQPTLGRRARMERVKALRRESQKLEQQLNELKGAERKVEHSLKRARDLLSDGALLELADPGPALAVARQQAEQAAEREQVHQTKANTLAAHLQALQVRRNSLRALLADAHLLDPPDHQVALEMLEERQRTAGAARTRLDRSAAARRTVEERLDVLRTLPLSESEREALQAELVAKRQARDKLAAPLEALRYVEDNLPALAWSDAPAALAQQQALRPALEEQLRRAETELERAETAQNEAEVAYEKAAQAAQQAQAAVEQLDAALTRDREELSESGVDDASDEALAAAESRHSELQQQTTSLDRQERTLNGQVAEARVRHEAQGQQVEALRRTHDEVSSQWRPVAERWQRIQEEAQKADVLASAMTPALVEATGTCGSLNLYQEARSKGELLAERMARAEGGHERAAAITTWLGEASRDVGLAYLRAWLDAREWLRQRVPPQIAEVDDPLETLARVADHLGRLQERLGQQEKQLRGQSEDVARSIETQRRKARREVTRLNQELRNVRFGSIHGVQIQVRPVETRERVLRALREGEAQQLLFQSEMPIEEAMAELFKRYGGGQTGGHRLLDYREYLDLQVEVLRQASPAWEQANPTRMSTGEAIGVGAAIMMVVLTAWERHANLLRAKRAAGTLRLLFLDEANRLSQDNLSVLFELCQSLELQLLIAAPEVAQAQGNTTYHLVRQVDEHGREVVRATGRRTLQAAL
jgi:chromosome partition protein MukB